MATYVIGDVQGCWKTLQRLLETIDFSPKRDLVRFAGDLVNRGPGSLEVLRWATEHEHCVEAVLGNHDVHLLALAEGVSHPKKRDTLAPVLDAPDRDDLLGWLVTQPFVRRDDSWLLLHAGLAAPWTADDAMQLADQLSSRLRGSRRRALEELFGEPVHAWSEALDDSERRRCAAYFLTRVRTCHADGSACAHFTGPPEHAPDGCMPWFRVPGRRSEDVEVLFGHWAALGTHFGDGVVALDSACVWGGELTAFRLEDRAVFRAPLAEGDGAIASAS